jgi:peptidyl-dipeptidase Dcp
MWEAYSTRCNGGKFDNTKIIDTLVNLRLERANILGFKTHADYVLDNCLAKTPQAVNTCLMQIWGPALSKAKQECAEYQKMFSKDMAAAGQAKTETLQP